MPRPDRSNALDHVVVVMFENRSFDNLLGRLYEPGEVPSFEGVAGQDLANPIPDGRRTPSRSGGSSRTGPPQHEHPVARTRARSTSTSTRSCSG